MSIKKSLNQVEWSLLDLVPALEGQDHRTAMENSLALAQFVEPLGYKRFWISEHHNTASLVSSATVLLIQYVAQGTHNIRVGSGGIMLPNHAPLVVAEQFGTLDTLFPGRIDLGLGRAPGTDQLTARALRRNRLEKVNDFPDEVQELQFYLSKESADSAVKAIPGLGTEVPMYLLGSSTFSAQLAASLGLPYAFASHFAPDYLFDALRIYHTEFKPSRQLVRPYTMAGANVIVADTDEEAARLATSGDQFALNIIRNERKPLQPPVDDMDALWSPMERVHVERMRHYSFIGSPETVKNGLEHFIERTQVDEIIVTTYVYDQEARRKSFKLLADLRKKS